MAAKRPCTVLIVEDNGIFRRVLREALRARFADLRILEAADLAEGRAQLCEGEPDLVFLDIGLPDGNGLDLAEVIRRERPEAVVVVCTNNDLPEYRQAAAARGAAQFVPKEKLDWDALGSLVEAALGPSALGRAASAAGAVP